MRDPLLALAGLLGLTGVGVGAFGAHALAARLGPAAATWETGVQYHLVHAAALLALALLAPRAPLLRTAGWLMGLGVLLFSGSLYLLSLDGPRWLGPVTPLGGLAFLLAWGLVIAGALRRSAP
ncbi:MAG: DUF423 domain-containing protein [Pseudomonadales bacterium]|jgi:uncharacterized membrane protein YgdD (TMEM256/DUF423 family)|nr:DUF423 domain-containing protein [Pseudomonadales bacterium]